MVKKTKAGRGGRGSGKSAARTPGRPSGARATSGAVRAGKSGGRAAAANGGAKKRAAAKKTATKKRAVGGAASKKAAAKQAGAKKPAGKAAAKKTSARRSADKQPEAAAKAPAASKKAAARRPRSRRMTRMTVQEALISLATLQERWPELEWLDAIVLYGPQLRSGDSFREFSFLVIHHGLTTPSQARAARAELDALLATAVPIKRRIHLVREPELLDRLRQEDPAVEALLGQPIAVWVR